MMVEVNYVAVVIAAVASMIVGFFWYSPMLFAKPWMKLMGHTAKSMKSAQKQMGMTYGISFIVALVTAYVLKQLGGNVTIAFWAWLGFVMPVQITDVLFGGKKWMLFFINTGYQLVSLLAMGIVLGLLR